VTVKIRGLLRGCILNILPTKSLNLLYATPSEASRYEGNMTWKPLEKKSLERRMVKVPLSEQN
jgi:hypothetical protein